MDGSTLRWDTLIRGALVFDGRGGAPSRVDVAVRGGRVAAMGPSLSGEADEVVEADGLWLMPGLIDVHTHFDLEVELAPGLPEAVRHGSTTVIMSNCSLGLAFGAQRRNGEDPIVDCFARVENVPKHVLRKVADTVDWSDSAEYLRHFDDMPLGPNVVAMIPHSMLRIETMGLQASVERDPTAQELAQMEALVEKGMREGYVGFSTDALPFHYLANQPNTRKQIPTQFARHDEIRRLTDVVRRWDRVWQATPPKDSKIGVIRTFMLTSGRLFGRPLKLTAVAALDLVMNRSILRMGLLLSKLLNSRLLRGNFRLQALPAEFKVWSDGVITPIAEEVPELRRLNECDLDDRAARRRILDEPTYRDDFRRMWYRGKRGFGLARLKRWLRLDDNVLSRDLKDMFVEQGPAPQWKGESMQAIYQRLQGWQANGRGARGEAEAEAFARLGGQVKDDADFVLALLREYDTDLRWWTVTANADPKVVERLLFNPLLLPGFNDSGAHLTNMAFYDGNLRMLKIAQRHGLEKVGLAVHRLSREPADFFGLDVGLIEAGGRADLLLIDPSALSRWDPQRSYDYVWREDFEHHQMVNRSDVVVRVMINGGTAFADGGFGPDFGRVRLGSVLRHRDADSAAAVALAA